MKGRCVGAVSLATLLFWMPCFAFAQESTPSKSRAEGLLAPVLPILKELMGEPVPQPQCRPVSAAELQKIADPELAALVRLGPHGNASPESLAAARDTLWPFWVAYYPLGSDCILLPGGTGVLAQRVRSQAPDGVEPARFLRDFVQLSLANELVRRTLDQRYNFARRFAECRSPDECQALQALLEGRALAITRMAAQKLGTDAVLPLLTERYLQLVSSNAPQGWLVEQHYRACALGLAFFDFADAQRIPDAERRVFAHPPTQLTLVQRPELYWQVEAPLRPGLEGRLARQAKTLPHWHWEWAPQPWTPDMVRSVAQLLGAEQRVNPCLAAWQEGASLIWRDKLIPGAQVAVGAVRFADARTAQAFYALSIDMQREQDKLLNFSSNAPQRVIRSQSESIEFSGAEDAVRTEKQFQVVGSKEPPIAVTALLLRAGELVVLFTWRDCPANPDWAGRLLAGITAEVPQP